MIMIDTEGTVRGLERFSGLFNLEVWKVRVS